METISITIRGETYSYQIASEAVDIVLAAFTSLYQPIDVPTVEGDEDHPGTKPMPPTEHMAYRIRLFAEDVAAGYAAQQDSLLTPTMDAVRPFLTPRG